MDYSTWAVILLLVGITLLVAEVFIPSGGLISLAAGTALLMAVGCAWRAWWVVSPGYFWSFLASMAVILPLVVCVAFSMWPNTSIGKRAILAAPSPAEVASFVEQEEHLSRMVGKLSETATMLNPAGFIRMEGKRVHCQSEGMIIESGVRVRVISVHGNGVVVRRLTEREEIAEKEAAAEAEQANRPLDFDMS